jgi:hypothetical protein
MEEMNEQKILSEEVITFVKLAATYCGLVEQGGPAGRREWFTELRDLLAGLCVQALRLPQVEPLSPEGNQKFVNEEEYNTVLQNVRKKAGQWDEYPEVYDPEDPVEELDITARISEDCADIFQDLKDFITLYHVGNYEVMNDALWEVRENFDRLWGQKLLNVLRTVHRLLTHTDLSDEEEEEEPGTTQERDTSDWFISRRQEEWRKDDR